MICQFFYITSKKLTSHNPVIFFRACSRSQYFFVNGLAGKIIYADYRCFEFYWKWDHCKCPFKLRIYPIFIEWRALESKKYVKGSNSHYDEDLIIGRSKSGWQSIKTKFFQTYLRVFKKSSYLFLQCRNI